MPSIWYHGTSAERWEEIQEQKKLGGAGAIWLATNPQEASCYGPIVLKIRYNPKGPPSDNYVKGCWQIRVYIAMTIKNIWVMKKPIRPTSMMVKRLIDEYNPSCGAAAATTEWLRKEFDL